MLDGYMAFFYSANFSFVLESLVHNAIKPKEAFENQILDST